MPLSIGSERNNGKRVSAENGRPGSVLIALQSRYLQAMSDLQYITLPGDAGRMPSVGYGTWQAADEELEQALEVALEVGYRHIDTAAAYANENVIGKVINKWISDGKVNREDLFIVTKLPPTGARPEGVEKYLKLSLEYLQLDYVDLYLVHTPFAFVDGPDLHPVSEDGSILLDKSTDLVAVWKAMEEQVDQGRAKAIGVSNFNTKQIERILDVARIRPVNLQIELHLYFQQKELVAFCNEHDISVCAYSPLGSRGIATFLTSIGIEKELPDVLNNPTVADIAQKYSKTPAQVLLRYTVQRGIAVIPKSSNPSRIRENFQIFDFALSDEDMDTLAGLDQGDSARIVDFCFFKGIKEHPEFPF